MQPTFYANMILERARELLQTQVYIGQGYNRHAARLILAEVQRDLGQDAVDQLITELNMTEVFGFNPGEHFKSP
jgi:hypothetical protein